MTKDTESKQVAVSSGMKPLSVRDAKLLALMIDLNNSDKEMLADKRCPYAPGGGYYSAKKRVRPYYDAHVLGAVEDAVTILKSAAPKAARNFIKKIDDSNAGVSMEASKEILDRIGVIRIDGKKTQVNIAGNEMSIQFVGEE